MERKFGALIIDMQEYFLPQIGEAKRNEIIAAQGSLLAYFAEMGMQTFVIEMSGAGRTHPDIIRGIDYFTVSKKGLSSFRDTNLDVVLKEKGLTDLVLAGICASDCVKATACGAFSYGYPVHLAEDLVADPYFTPRSQTDSTRRWYRNNCSYHKTHADLIGSISNADATRISSAIGA